MKNIIDLGNSCGIQCCELHFCMKYRSHVCFSVPEIYNRDPSISVINDNVDLPSLVYYDHDGCLELRPSYTCGR